MPKGTQPKKEWVLLVVTDGGNTLTVVARGEDTRSMRAEAERRGRHKEADPKVVYQVGALIDEPFRVKQEVQVKTKRVRVDLKEASRAQ